MESWPFQMRVEGCEHTDQSSDNEGDRDGEIRSAFRWCPHVIHIQTQTHLVQGDCVSETNDDVTGNRTRNDHLLDRSRPAQVAVAFKYWVKGQGGGEAQRGPRHRYTSVRNGKHHDKTATEAPALSGFPGRRGRRKEWRSREQQVVAAKDRCRGISAARFALRQRHIFVEESHFGQFFGGPISESGQTERESVRLM